MGNALYLELLIGKALKQSWISEILDHLQQKGYLRKFSQKGKKGSYPILVHRYLITRGSYEGKMLNATLSMDWKNPVYTDPDDTEKTPGTEQYDPQMFTGKDPDDPGMSTPIMDKLDKEKKGEVGQVVEGGEVEPRGATTEIVQKKSYFLEPSEYELITGGK